MVRWETYRTGDKKVYIMSLERNSWVYMHPNLCLFMEGAF